MITKISELPPELHLLRLYMWKWRPSKMLEDKSIPLFTHEILMASTKPVEEISLFHQVITEN